MNPSEKLLNDYEQYIKNIWKKSEREFSDED